MKAKTINKETVLDMGVTDRGFPRFKPGDAIRVAQMIKEGEKERIQYFEGDIIGIHNNGIASTFTIRRIAANGIAVEKIIPYHSPLLVGIEFLREGDVRRAKLYYMRERIGKSARVKEKVRAHGSSAPVAPVTEKIEYVKEAPAAPADVKSDAAE